LDAKGEFGFREFSLAPIPAAQSMLLVLEDCAIPVLEDLGKPIVVLLLETVELNYTGL
jgi:hypothetical protein